MSNQAVHTVRLDEDYVAQGPTYQQWFASQEVQALRAASPDPEDFDDRSRDMFIDAHNIWQIINDPDDGVQAKLVKRLERGRVANPIVGGLIRHVEPDNRFEQEDLRGLEDVEEHLVVFESEDDRQEFQNAIAVNKVGEGVDRYSGDTGGTRIITAEVYEVIEKLHKMYIQDPLRSKRERSNRAMAREIQQDLLMRWKELGLTEPVVVSDVTIDKIIRGVYRSQLRYGIPSEANFRTWESSMTEKAGAFKLKAEDREGRAAFDFTRRVLISMALHKYRETITDPGALSSFYDARNEEAFNKATDTYLRTMFDEHNVDFPQNASFVQRRGEVLQVANNMRYPDDVSQAQMRTMFRKFTPEQKAEYTKATAETRRAAKPTFYEEPEADTFEPV